jgi:hypothetical protein
VKFDALEQTSINKVWRHLLGKVKTPRRMEPATETRS